MNNDSFFSMDRLMEFGLSAAMAQQMVRSMNDSMQSMHTVGSAANLKGAQLSEQLQFYAILEGRRAGPFSENDLTNLILSRQLNVPGTDKAKGE
jgi:hypothetical protein